MKQYLSLRKNERIRLEVYHLSKIRASISITDIERCEALKGFESPREFEGLRGFEGLKRFWDLKGWRSERV